MMAIVAVICFALVIYGQKTVGIPYLGIQLVGVAGLLTLLYIYNRRYR